MAITISGSGITSANIAADGIDGSKIADDALDSEHYTDSSIDTAHIDDDQVTYAKIQNVSADERILGRVSGAGGVIEELTKAQVLTFANVADGAEANVANTAITTADTSWTGSQRATLVTDNDGSFDMDLGQNFKCTPSGGFALTFTNITDGQSGFILLINSGGHTITAHANSKKDEDLLDTVSTAGTYLLSYLSDGTNVYLTTSAIYT